MNNVDRALRQSLSDEDAELLERLAGDEALHKQLLATFRGQMWWFNTIGWIAGFVLFGVGCVMAWRFLNAAAIAEMLRWGAASALAFAGLALIKVWFWMELHKNAVVREVKRLEIQVAGLADQLRKS
jgi:hypothetical protein